MASMFKRRAGMKSGYVRIAVFTKPIGYSFKSLVRMRVLRFNRLGYTPDREQDASLPTHAAGSSAAAVRPSGLDLRNQI
jgi:hypothetical protein